jgi:hypothetical protein
MTILLPDEVNAINCDENIPTCDELHGNWEQDLYKTITNKSEKDTIDTACDIHEEERLEVPPVPMNECLHLIARLENTEGEFGDEILLDLLNSAECRGRVGECRSLKRE